MASTFTVNVILACVLSLNPQTERRTKIIKSWKSLQAKSERLNIEWTEDVTHPKGTVSMVLQGLPGASIKSNESVPDNDLITKESCAMFFQNGKYRVDITQTLWNGSDRSFARQTLARINNGVTNAEFKRSNKLPWSQAVLKPPSSVIRDFNLMPPLYALNPLYTHLRSFADSDIDWKELGTANGCIIYELFEQSGRMLLQIDIKSLLITQYELYNINSNRPSEIVSIIYSSDILPVVKGWDARYFTKDTLTKRYRGKVVRTTFDNTDDEKLFDTTIPPDTRVIDSTGSTTRHSYVDQGNTEHNLNDVKDRRDYIMSIDSNSHTNRITLILFATFIVAVLLLILTILLVRKRIKASK